MIEMLISIRQTSATAMSQMDGVVHNPPFSTLAEKTRVAMRMAQQVTWAAAHAALERRFEMRAQAKELP